MVQSKAATVDGYLAELDKDRRAEIQAVRDLVNQNLPDGFTECMQYGMISWVVPREVYPKTYNDQPLGIASLAAQKNYSSIYLMGIYGDPETEKWFHDAYRASGKKLDMGKSCVRFRRAEDLAFDVIGEAIARVTPEQFIDIYERARGLKH